MRRDVWAVLLEMGTITKFSSRFALARRVSTRGCFHCFHFMGCSSVISRIVESSGFSTRQLFERPAFWGREGYTYWKGRFTPPNVRVLIVRFLFYYGTQCVQLVR